MAKRDPENRQRYVIVGGGIAGMNCAETLRQSGFTGEIVMISDEKVAPYDRTLLSKVLATGDASKLSLRNTDFFEEAGITLKLGQRVQSIDKVHHLVRFGSDVSADESLHYDKLLLATGSRVRKLNYPGINLPGVYYLRTDQD